MSDIDVEILAHPADQGPIARKLLDAAGDAPEAVRTISGGFLVPSEVAKAAGLARQSVEAPAQDGVIDGGVERLTGKSLDQALREVGLPTSGATAEKQARLTEFLATQG